MKNIIKLMVTGMVIVFVLMGCNNDDEANETSENQETEESNEASETAGEGEAASDETDSSDSEVEILSLGETGTMETILGDFEVTPTSVQFLKEIEDGDSSVEPVNGVFVVVDVTLKNIDEEAIESSDIGSADLFPEGAGGMANTPGYSSIENFEGEIAPGEVMTGKLVFNHLEVDYYELAFGFGYTSDLSNEVRWEFTADEVE